MPTIETTDEVEFDGISASFCGPYGTILEGFTLYRDGDAVFLGDQSDRDVYRRAKEALGE